MERGISTPFKLPLWSEWTVNIKETILTCFTCQLGTPALKILAIQSLLKHLKEVRKYHELPTVLSEYRIPSILYVDIACQLFALKHWSALRSLISFWPLETFQLSQIMQPQCQNCWQNFLETDDIDDTEREGGDTERQMFRKLFKHILDGYFSVVKSILENNGCKGPLRVLDLTLNPSQEIRGFLWEDEFRRLGRRVTKSLDVCVLAGLHKKAQPPTSWDHKNGSKSSEHEKTDDSDCSWDSPSGQNTHFIIDEKNDFSNFEISTFDPVLFNSWSPDTIPNAHSSAKVESEAEIGVWNGNALDLSHLTEMPLFTVKIDASISEKSWDILMWIRQRYDDFLPSPSPVTIQIRFLEVSLHEEHKFSTIISRLPENIQALQLAEIFEKRSAKTLASYLPRFQAVRFLDFGSCAFDLVDDPRLVDTIAASLGQLPRLERLSLAHNSITSCLGQLLSQLAHGLTLLDVSCCCLNEDDLLYIGDSIHCFSLHSLNLGSNELGLHWHLMLPLLDKLGYSSNLRILDLSSNEFVESQFVTLCRMSMVSLPSLSLLDLSWHELTLATMIDIIELLSSKSALRTFCLSTPVDMAEAGYDQPESWQSFVDFTYQLTEKYRSASSGHYPLSLHWCLM